MIMHPNPQRRQLFLVKFQFIDKLNRQTVAVAAIAGDPPNRASPRTCQTAGATQTPGRGNIIFVRPRKNKWL